ncbi:MAG TPA: hypothetical protein VKP67_28715 [Xanthobacteraceae bacterium]|nr:hypothetical protein [Xanthobacteraceae bacterium]
MALTATELFNDATTREIGGVGPDQVNLIVSDLIGAQQMLSEASPQINDLSDLHTHVIINQLNEEIASVENANSPTGTLILGTDLGQFVGRAINDIHRDIIDIAQGDEGVQALFNPTPLPDLATAPAPFHDNADQTAFITQWIQDSNHLGQAAVAIANDGFNADSDELIQQIQAYANNANAFDQSQGGLWSARFWNELRSDGTAGTAAAALVEGLQTHNAGEVSAAAEQLSTNAADVAGNNRMADGGSYADIVAAAQAPAANGDPAAGNQGGNAGGNQAAGDPAANAGGNQAAADPAANAGGNPAAADPAANPGGNQAAADQGGNQGAGDHGANAGGNQAAGDHGANPGGGQAAGDHGNAGGGQVTGAQGDHPDGNQTAGGQDGNAAGHPAAADQGGGNNLVADLTALFHGGGPNSVAAVVADLSALAHAAGVQGNAVTALTQLLTGGAAGQSGGGAPAASHDDGSVDPTPAVQHHSFEHFWHH